MLTPLNIIVCKFLRIFSFFFKDDSHVHTRLSTSKVVSTVGGMFWNRSCRGNGFLTFIRVFTGCKLLWFKTECVLAWFSHLYHCLSRVHLWMYQLFCNVRSPKCTRQCQKTVSITPMMIWNRNCCQLTSTLVFPLIISTWKPVSPFRFCDRFKLEMAVPCSLVHLWMYRLFWNHRYIVCSPKCPRQR